MWNLTKIVTAVLVLGAILQPGGLVQATHALGEALGSPDGPAGPGLLDVVGMLIGGLVGTLQGLPEPWHGIALATGGLLGLVMLLSILRAVAMTALRLAGWLRDAFV